MALRSQRELLWVRSILVACLALGLLLLAGCNWLFPKPDLPRPEVEEVVSQVVSAAAGGTIVVTEEISPTLAGLELVIPPGALEADQRINIGKVVGGLPPHPEEYVTLGYSFSLEPAGVSFRTPATLRITFPLEVWEPWSNLIAPKDVLLMRYDKGLRSWIRVSSHFEAGVLTAEIESFSFWDVVFFWRPSNPASAEKVREQAPLATRR